MEHTSLEHRAGGDGGSMPPRGHTIYLYYINDWAEGPDAMLFQVAMAVTNLLAVMSYMYCQDAVTMSVHHM